MPLTAPSQPHRTGIKGSVILLVYRVSVKATDKHTISPSHPGPAKTDPFSPDAALAV
jgi:hypothetical protein